MLDSSPFHRLISTGGSSKLITHTSVVYQKASKAHSLCCWPDARLETLFTRFGVKVETLLL